MLCQNCQKREATTHIKRVINGEATESHLCEECAKELGFDEFFDDFSLSIPNIFSSFFKDSAFALAGAKNELCEKCGSSFDDIIRSGMVGCADCYSRFYDRLLPSIQRIHGRTGHVGRTPIEYTKVDDVPAEEEKKELSAEDKIKELEAQMQKAVDAQNFEQAAALRDEIKELRGKEEK